MKKLMFSTVLSTLFVFGAYAAEQNLDVQQIPETKRVSTLIIELPSELPNAVINLNIPGETQPEIFQNVRNGDVLNLAVPLSTSLEEFVNTTDFPYFNRSASAGRFAYKEPNVLAIMLETATDQNSTSFYVEGPLFHKDSYLKTGNNIFDGIPLASDTTSTMKLMVRMHNGVIPSYRIFSETVHKD